MLQTQVRYRWAFAITLLLTLAGWTTVGADASQRSRTRLTGEVRDAFGRPAAGAVIEITGSGSQAVRSDSNGTFVIDLAAGTYRVSVRRLDHQPWTEQVHVAGPRQHLLVELASRTLSLPPVRVSASRHDAAKLQPPGQYRLTGSVLESRIGSFEDVMRSVQELPGVGSASDLHGEVYVRGSGSGTNVVYLDGVEVQFPFHMLGFNSIFSPGVIDHVDFFSGTAPVEYGGATGGVLAIESRGARAETNGATMGLSYLSGHLEAAGGNRTRGWALSLRRSYHDKLVGWLNARSGRQVPSFYDGMLRWRWRPHRDHLLVAGILTAGDGIALDSPEAQAQQYDFLRDANRSNAPVSFGTDNDALTLDNRITVGSLQWRALLDRNAYLETTVGIVPQRFRFTLLGASDERVQLQALTLSLRQTLTWQGSGHRLRCGWQLQREDAEHDVAAYASILNLRESNSTLNLTTLKDRYDFTERKRRDIASLYGSDTWQLWPQHLQLVAGLRLQHDVLTHDNTAAPQVALSWLGTDRWQVRAAWGVSHALRSRAMEIRPKAGGGTLGTERAVETSLGVTHRWNTQFRSGITGYTKNLSNLVYESAPAYYDNGSLGRAKGVESWLEYVPENTPLHFTVQYTWAHVMQRDPVAWRRNLSLSPNNELLYGAELEPSYWYSPIQDQRHNLRLVARYAPGLWEFGSRLEIASGRPYAALAGVVEEPKGVYLAVEGRRGNARLPAYHRLDVRVTRHFRSGTAGVRWSLYAEVLNATGADNIFQLRYDPTYSRRYAISMLPTLPTLGIEARF